MAGESSGDNLGAALIEAIAARAPGTRFVGVAGPRMQAAGCERLADADELAVMGLFEVLHHLPRLLSLRARVRRAMRELKPDVFVGIDAPEFNLGLAADLHAAGLSTVQYVSPQVWAWRRGRAARMARARDDPGKREQREQSGGREHSQGHAGRHDREARGREPHVERHGAIAAHALHEVALADESVLVEVGDGVHHGERHDEPGRHEPPPPRRDGIRFDSGHALIVVGSGGELISPRDPTPSAGGSAPASFFGMSGVG